ncbi:MAG: cupin domain-containing protein [Defluviitaleaceae bacterium]|nr:cupin domain-containing protein [Defluviitaleaceae bacterium]
MPHPQPLPPARMPVRLMDYGPQPCVIDIEQATNQNNNYRTTLWTGQHMQLTVMSLLPGEDIGLEVHPNTDQFLRIESGQGIVQMGHTRNHLNIREAAFEGSAIFVPAGTWHNVTNIGHTPMKLYSIYAPPEHTHGTMHRTKAIAEREEMH